MIDSADMGTAVIVGANRGIGLELCRQIRGRGHYVIAVCRKSSAELEALNVRVEVGVDVASDDAVRQLGNRLTGLPIDLLIQNAGVLERHNLDRNVIDSIRRQFEVNALGVLRVVAALTANIVSPGGKIAIISSRMGSLADNKTGGSYGYRMSKAAANMAGVSLAHDLRPKGIAVGMIHPGFVRTALVNNKGEVEPSDAATGILRQVDRLSMETTGSFWHANGETLPW